jgi:hypothetical protein
VHELLFGEPIGRLGVGGRKTITRIWRKTGGMVWIGFIWLRIGTDVEL